MSNEPITTIAASPSTPALVGLRAASYRFKLLDQYDRPIGELHPDRTETPIITLQADRAIQRDMTTFNLIPQERAHVNPLSDRVAPYIILANGSESPLGVFLFSDDSQPIYSYGPTMSASLVDKGLILDQPVEHSVSVSTNSAVRDAVIELLAEVGIVGVVETGDAIVGAPMSWPAGTSRRQIILDLGVVAGYMAPYFDARGVCFVKAVIDPEEAPVDATHTEGGSVYASSIVNSNDLLRTPNRVVVLGADASSAPIVGSFDIPASAPNSYFNRGFRMTEVVQQQGLSSSGQAAAAARSYAMSRTVFEYLSFTSPPDPRHDVFSVVQFNGERWLEQAWSLPCTPDGPMTHSLRRVLNG